MTTRNRSVRNVALISAAVLAGIGAAHGTTAAAATDTWTGTASDTNWGTIGNWSTSNSGGIPLTDDLLQFNGSSNLVAVNNINPLTIDGITFAAGSGAYNLNGTSVTVDTAYESVGGSPTGGNLTDSNGNSGTTEAINLPIAISAGIHTISTSSGSGPLSFSGAISRVAGSMVQFTAGGGNIGVGSNLSNTNNIIGGWAIYGNNNWAAVSGGNVVAYSGTNESGSFSGTAGTNYNLTAGGTVTISGGAMNSLDVATSSGTSRTVNIGTMTLGASGGIFRNSVQSGTITISGTTLTCGTSGTGGEFSLINTDATSARLLISATIADNGSGKVAVDEYGSINFNNNNTYSGGTYITLGDGYLNGSTATLGSGPVYVYPGGRADYGGANGETVPNNFFIGGYGYSAGTNPGAIKGTYNGTFNGTITLLSSASIDPNAGGTGNTCTFNGPITGTGSLTIGGPANVTAGTATLGGTNNYTGDLVIDATANANGGSGIKIKSSSNNNIIANGGNVALIGGTSGIASFDLNGSAQSINGLTSPSGTVANAIVTSSASGAVLTLGGSSTAASFGGSIQGGSNLGITKSGGGIQTLAGSNTYTGNTTINQGILSITGSLASTPVGISGGTLAGTGSIAGTVTLNSGGIDPGATGPGSVGTLTLNGGLTVNGGNLGFDLGSNGSGDQINASAGAINFAGSSTITPGGGTPGSVYTLITSSAMTGTLPTLVQPSGTTRFGYSYDPSSYNGTNSATSLIIDVNGAIANLTWNNTGLSGDGQTWDVVQSKNWASSATAGNPNEYYQGDNVTFNDSNNGNYSVVLNTNVSPGSVIVATNGAYSFSGTGSIHGATGLTMNSSIGTGSLTISTANTYSGGTTLYAGTLTTNAAAALGTGSVTLNGGTLNINNAAGLGTGTLIINAGTIDNTSPGPVNLSTSNPQTWNGNFIFTGTQNLGLGNGLVTLNSGGGTVTTTVTNTGAVLTIGGQITGNAQALIKAGPGTMVLTANNNFSGGVTVNAGTLKVTGSGGNSALGSGPTTVNLNGTLVGTAADAFGYASNVNPQVININGGTVTDANTSNYRITLPNLNFSGGTLTSVSGNSGDGSGEYSLLGIGANCLVTTTASATTATINAAKISMQNPTTFNVAAGMTISGIDLSISSQIVPYGVQPLTLVGTGVMSLAAANTYPGPTNIAGGTLQVNTLANGGTPSGIGNSSNAAANLILNGGTLKYVGTGATSDRLFTVGPNGGTLDASGTGAINFNNSGSVAQSFPGARTLVLTGTNTGNNTLAASVSDGGPNPDPTSVVKNGTGTWVLSGSSSYTGATTISDGALIVTGSLTGNGPANISGGKLYGTGTINGMVYLAGGTIDPGTSGPGSIGTLNLNGGLTISSGTNYLNLDLGSTTNDLIAAGSATVAFNSASNLALTGGNNGSTYTIVTSGNMTGTAIPTLIQPAANRTVYMYDPASYSLTNTTSTSLIVDVSSSAANLTWDNAGLPGDGITWDVNNNQNWNSSAASSPNVFLQGDNVLFNDINNGHYNVSIATSVQPGSVTVNTNGAYNFGGAGNISGGANVSISSPGGTGSLTIGTANSYTGGTTLNSGTLNIDNASALGTGTLTMNGGTIDNTSAAPITLSTNNAQVWGNAVTFTGTQNLNMGTGSVTLNGSTSTTVTVTTAANGNSGIFTVAGVISDGSGNSLVKKGPGTLFLTGANTFDGGVTINAGVLQVTSPGGGTSGLGASNTSVTVNANGTLIGAGSDAFGYNASNPGLMTININGGTVTDLGTSDYRITLPNISFTGGTLTSSPLNTGKSDGSGEYSLYAGTVETNATTTTAVISAGAVSLQTGNTNASALFNVASGSVTSGSHPGVDLYISSTLENYLGQIGGITKIGAGTMELAGSNTYTGGTLVNAGKLVLASANAFPGNTLLNLSSGAIVQIAASSGNASFVPTLSALNNSGLIDLTNNAMVVHNGNFGTLWSQVRTGYNGGSWTVVPGTTSAIISSTAATDLTHLTAVGIATGLTSFQAAGGSVAVATTDVVLKFTYYGDANLDGQVSSADYTRIDNGYLSNSTLTGWQNGDFNYDGVINGSDYTLIDNAFNMQGVQLSAQIAGPSAQVAASSSVPEPAGLVTISAVVTAGLLGRRRKRS